MFFLITHLFVKAQVTETVSYTHLDVYKRQGEDCYIYNLAEIKIDSNVSIEHRNFFNTGGHDYKNTTCYIFAKPIIIEDEAWAVSYTHLDVYKRQIYMC